MPFFDLQFALLFGLSLIIGCGSDEAPMSIETGSMAEAEPMPTANGAFSEAEAVANASVDVRPGADGQGGEAVPDAKAAQIQRQIIYTAQLTLVVEEFEGVPEKVETIANDHGGFVASSNLHGSSGSPRSGNWTIRVPVKKYGTFLEAAKTLGEFQSQTTESQEVTAEFYDVQARIANKQRQEQRLIELLAEATGKLKDVLEVEQQLARVREEIERMQGRMRVLKDLTSFSTVTLTINEIKGYQPAAAPTFGNRVSRAWNGTLVTLLATGQNLVIFLVAVGPWLVILAIPVVLFIGLIRLVRRKRVAS